MHDSRAGVSMQQAGGGEGGGDELEAGSDHVTGSACRSCRNWGEGACVNSCVGACVGA